MRMIQFTSFGGPEVLDAREVPEPAKREGRVRVRVLARAVNPVDVAGRSGLLGAMVSLPAVPGWDFVGELIDEDAGTRVLGFIPGFSQPGQGSYADVISVDPGWIAPVDPSIDPGQAAVGAMNGSTALLALRNLEVTEGQTLLVTGASGAVGGAAVQFAARMGAKVLAVASQGDAAYVESLTPHVINAGRDAQRVLDQAHEVDALLDTTGQATALLAAVRDGGAATTVVPTAPESVRSIRTSLTWLEPDPADLATIAKALAEGVLTPRVAETFGLEQAAQAHARFERGGLRGKIALV